MRANETENAALTLLELLVIVAIMGIVATLLFPILGRSHARAQSAACVNRLKQWGVAFQMYAQDNGGWLFTTKHWESTKFTVGDKEVLNVYSRYLHEATSDRIVELRNCPNVLIRANLAGLKAGSKYSYSMNWPNVKTEAGYQLATADSYGGASYHLDRIPKPPEFLLIVDSDGTRYGLRSHDLKGMVSSVVDRHGGGVNVLWADQHANFVGFEAIIAQSALSDNENTWFQAN